MATVEVDVVGAQSKSTAHFVGAVPHHLATTQLLVIFSTVALRKLLRVYFL